MVRRKLGEKNIKVYASGRLIFDGKEYRCAIGKNGLTKNTKEGDEATPIGCFHIREIFYRSDKMEKPQTVFPIRELHEDDGWCDDPSDKKYNRFVKLPYDASHERLWREDALYDIIVVLGFNDDPPIPGKGSAIFMHVARPTYSPTAGCITTDVGDLLKLLADVEMNTLVCIQGEN